MQYGLLKSSALNLGDEIQSVVIKPLLPRVDVLLDGRYLHGVTSAHRIKLIIHGCFNSERDNWPPSSVIDPLIISIHIGEYARKEFTSDASIRYFKQHEPIGCRDLVTRDLLRQCDVEAYFSGCVTLMLRNEEVERANEILLVDLDAEAMQHIPAHMRTQVTVVHHGEGIPFESVASKLWRYSPKIYRAVKATKVHLALDTLQRRVVAFRETPARSAQRFHKAESLIRRYAQAKLVITSRLHGALPCLALDTPVILVRRDLETPRLSGLINYMRAYSVEEFKYRIKEVNPQNPEPNPRSIDDLRTSLTQACQTFLQEDKK